jgi:hypothetical protein
MKHDIVFPNNNEKDFTAVAKKLGTIELLFVYPFPNKTKDSNTITIATPNQLKSGSANTENVIVRSDPEKDRWLMEKIKPSMMFGFEFQNRKDFLHHRNSAINHITAKIMARNKIAYGFPVAELINAPKWKQPIIIGRMQQNIVLCKKYGVEIIIASFAKDPMDMRSLKDVKCLVD